MTELFASDRATTTVSSGGTTAPSGGTSESWTVASSGMFGAAATGVSQFHVADPAAPSETILVTNVSGTTWTVTRGAESTAPVAHAAGFTVWQVVTTGFLSGAAGLAPLSPLNAAYGADPTGVADSTAALQACITAAGASGAAVVIPPGTYKTTATLDCRYPGLVIRGSGGDPNTIIKCATSNTPVVHFAGGNQDISGLTFTYATAQTSGQTTAIGIIFGDETMGSPWRGNYHELTILNAQTAIGIDPAISTKAGLFSCRLANIDIGTFSSSAIHLNSANGTGASNCTGCVFENIYISNSGGTCASQPVFFQSWDEFVINQLNIEHCVLSAQNALALNFVGNGVINSLHFEALTFSADGKAPLSMFELGTTVINGWTIKDCTFAGSASNPSVKFTGTGPTSVIISGYNEDGGTVTTPSHPLADFTTATNCGLQVSGVASVDASLTPANATNAGCHYRVMSAAGDYTAFALSAFGGEDLVSTINPAASSQALNLANGNVFDVTLNTATTLSFSGATSGVSCTFTLFLRQDGTGGRTVTWPGSVTWLGATPALTTTALALNVLVFQSLDGGTNWYGALVKPASSSQYLCTPVQYAPGSQTALATSSATMAAVSSANVNTGSFTAPASGSVVVTVSLVFQNSGTSDYTTFGLAAHGTVTPLVCNSNISEYLSGGKPVQQQMMFLVTGLTSGTSYNLDLLFGTNTGTATVYAYGNTSTTAGTTPGAPVIMTVEAV